MCLVTVALFCGSYSSSDPLDLGEALWLSHWQLGPQQQQQQQQSGARWAQHVSAESLSSLDELWTEGYFDQPMQWRLGFREFGTSIGLQVRGTTTVCGLQSGRSDQVLISSLASPAGC